MQNQKNNFLMPNFMDYEKILQIVKKLIILYDLKRIDIGALEPLLYKYDDKNIVDLVVSLKELNLDVRMTTNGSLLYKYAQALKDAEIDKVRVSLHSLNKKYSNMMSSTNAFDKTIKSIKYAIDIGLNIELNSLMLKGYEKEIINVIEFAQNNKIKLKIYNLYYTPYYVDDYRKYYLTSQEITDFLGNYLSNYNYFSIEEDSQRDRNIFSTDKAKVAVKTDDITINRDNQYCKNCIFKNECGEKFAEYIRIDPDLYFYPCYLRKDLRFNLLDEKIISNLYSFSNNFKIRLIVSAVCNFKCVFPDSGNFWCLKQGGGYIWRTNI